FTLVVTNNGPSGATGVLMSDVLPAGFEYKSSVASKGSYDVGTGQWSIGTLAHEASETLTIVADIVASNVVDAYANVATVTAEQPDTNTDNNTDDAGVTVEQEADLVTVKTLSSGSPTPNVG